MSTINITTKRTVSSIISDDSIEAHEIANTLLALGKKEVKDSGHMWRLVCAAVLRDPWCREATDQESFMEAFGKILEKTTDTKDIPVATKGKNKGKIPWRSWPVTKVRWQYATYIFNAVETQGAWGLVFDPEKPLPTLADVRKMIVKTKEKPLDTIKRCLEMAGKKLPEVEDVMDLKEINNIVASLSVLVATMVHEKGKS